MASTSAVTASEVDKTYAGRLIFKGLTLTVPRGQFTVLLGKNGAGKSTLLRLIAGLEPADSGEIRVLGSDVEIENVHRRQKVAFISEMIAADPSYSINQIVKAYSPLQPNWDSSIFDRFIHTSICHWTIGLETSPAVKKFNFCLRWRQGVSRIYFFWMRLHPYLMQTLDLRS